MNDETLMQNIKQYFEGHRKMTGHNPIQSDVDFELSVILRFGSTSQNPMEFLINSGICFFSNSIVALQVNSLTKVLSCSKSRLNNCLKKQNYEPISTPLPRQKEALESELKSCHTPFKDIRNWTFRKLPEHLKLAKELKANKNIIIEVDDLILAQEPKETTVMQQNELQPQISQRNEIFLSFQKDVYTFTFYDDQLFPY